MIVYTNNNIEKSYNAFACSFSHEVEKLNIKNSNVLSVVQKKLNDFVYWYNLCVQVLKEVDSLTKRILSKDSSTYDLLKTIDLSRICNTQIHHRIPKVLKKSTREINDSLKNIESFKVDILNTLSSSLFYYIKSSNNYLNVKSVEMNNQTNNVNAVINNIASTMKYELDLNGMEWNDIYNKAKNDSDKATYDAEESSEIKDDTVLDDLEKTLDTMNDVLNILNKYLETKKEIDKYKTQLQDDINDTREAIKQETDLMNSLTQSNNEIISSWENFNSKIESGYTYVQGHVTMGTDTFTYSYDSTTDTYYLNDSVTDRETIQTFIDNSVEINNQGIKNTSEHIDMFNEQLNEKENELDDINKRTKEQDERLIDTLSGGLKDIVSGGL